MSNQAFIIVRKGDEEKKISKASWDLLGSGKEGWHFVRNFDPNDKAIPKNTGAKTDAEYVPAEVRSMSEKAKSTDTTSANTDAGADKKDNVADPNNFTGNPAPDSTEAKEKLKQDPSQKTAEVKEKAKPGPKTKSK
jgi:hypothetical protein